MKIWQNLLVWYFHVSFFDEFYIDDDKISFKLMIIFLININWNLCSKIAYKISWLEFCWFGKRLFTNKISVNLFRSFTNDQSEAWKKFAPLIRLLNWRIGFGLRADYYNETKMIIGDFRKVGQSQGSVLQTNFSKLWKKLEKET